MDDDELRRGQPTSHVEFGEDVAILAGDGLFAEAVRIFCEQPGEPRRVLAALAELSAATGRRRHGRRPVRRRRRRARSDAEGLRALHALKTGRLIAASVGIVLTLEGLAEPETIPYRRFAAELGVLFQIVDDILDVTGSDEQLGKPMEATSDTANSPTSASSASSGRASSPPSRTPRRSRRWPRRAGETGDLKRVADYIFTRNE